MMTMRRMVAPGAAARELRSFDRIDLRT